MRITRTITGTKATVLTVDANTMIAGKHEYFISDTYESNDKLLKALKKRYEDGVTILSMVLSAEKIEELYGLDEGVFMQYAVKLDPKTRKPLCEKTAEPQVEPTAEPQVEPTAEPQVEPQVEPKTAEPQDVMTITAPVTITEVKAKATKIKKK